MTKRIIITLSFVIALALAGACNRPGGDEMPAPDTLVGEEVVDVINDATRVLSGVHNLPQSQEALPKLEKLDAALKTALGRAAELSPAEQQRLAEIAEHAAEGFLDQVERVQDIEGVPGTLHPTISSMRDRIGALTAMGEV